MFSSPTSKSTSKSSLICGQVRVLVLGDSGVGKSSLVHLIINGSSISKPPPTVGCTVSVKHVTYGSPVSSSNSVTSTSSAEFFVELWDVSGHQRYKSCRPLFYSQINGVIFVHDLSVRTTRDNLKNWVSEVASCGTFSAPSGSGGPFGLPVPYIVIGNKADSTKEGGRGSSGDLIDAARQWVERQGLLSTTNELPLTESFPGSPCVIAAAKEARIDKETVIKFFHKLIKRRYFSDETVVPKPWISTPVRRQPYYSSEKLSEDAIISSDASYDMNMMVHPLPAQRNLTPPPAVNPQQPASMSRNYNFPRFSLGISSQPDTSQSRLTDII